MKETIFRVSTQLFFQQSWEEFKKESWQWEARRRFLGEAEKLSDHFDLAVVGGTVSLPKQCTASPEFQEFLWALGFYDAAYQKPQRQDCIHYLNYVAGYKRAAYEGRGM